jgi:hypothetical protein
MFAYRLTGPHTAIPLPPKRSAPLQIRRRFKQLLSLQERLSLFALQARDKAAKLPPSTERDDLLYRAREAETASHLERWIKSRGLRPPT